MATFVSLSDVAVVEGIDLMDLFSAEAILREMVVRLILQSKEDCHRTHQKEKERLATIDGFIS